MRSTIKNDLLASIVVFLVALPLCMGIAIASGVPTEKAASVGILTGIVGGVLVGLFAGCPLQVSGPAAGLIVLIFELTQRIGWENIGAVVLVAGTLQIAAGFFHLGQWFRAVSPAVVHGMLAGIGVVIMASQFHIMLDDAPKKNGLENIKTIPDAILKGVIPNSDASHDDAARLGILTITILVFWKWLAPARLKLIPAPLVAVVTATLITAIWVLPIKRVSLPPNILDAIAFPHPPGFEDLQFWKTVVLNGLAFAFIASAETLLCAGAVDQMHKGPRSNYDKELVAQGIGNMTCGAIGALPLTGVIVRSSANIEAGGKTRLSAILHGVWLIVLVTFFGGVLRYVPTASLAAILVYTGFKLINVKHIKELWHYGKSQVFIYFATMIAIVLTDLLTGVITGVVISVLHLLQAFSKLDIRIEQHPDQNATILHLDGAATFIKLPKLAAALATVPTNSELHVRLNGLHHIDHACLDLLMGWEKQHKDSGGTLVIDWGSLTARFKTQKSNGDKDQH